MSPSHWAPVPLFPRLIAPLFHRFPVSLRPCSIVPLSHCTLVPLFPRLIAPLFHCSPVSLRPSSIVPQSHSAPIPLPLPPPLHVPLYPRLITPCSLFPRPIVPPSHSIPVSLFPRPISSPCALFHCCPVPNPNPILNLQWERDATGEPDELTFST